MSCFSISSICDPSSLRHDSENVPFPPCACAYKPGKSLDLLDGSQTGVIYFASTDDYDFNRGESPTPIIIDGTLEVPVDHNGGAIILSHGSGGRGDLQDRWTAF